MGFAVTGVELSRPAVVTATATQRDLRLHGAVIQGNAFDLPTNLPHPVDLVCSVGFAYYFQTEKRIALLRSFAAADTRHILVQYKTVETPKGRRNATRTDRYPFHFCTYEQMRTDAQQAGLECRKIVPIGHGSDRAFMLLAKP